MESVPGCPGQELTQWKHSDWSLARTRTRRRQPGQKGAYFWLMHGGIFCLLLCFVFVASRMEMLFPFNLHPQAQWILLPFSKHMVHTSKT